MKKGKQMKVFGVKVHEGNNMQQPKTLHISLRSVMKQDSSKFFDMNFRQGMGESLDT